MIFSGTTTLFFLSPKARSAFYLLLHTAAETLVDGTYYLDQRTRRSGPVIHAANVLYELSEGLSSGVFNDSAGLERLLVDVADAFDQLDTLNISATSLMVRRDYATTRRQRKRADALRDDAAGHRARVRRSLGRDATPSHLRLVSDDERS